MTAVPDPEPKPTPPEPDATDDEIMAWVCSLQRRLGGPGGWQADVFGYVLPLARLYPEIRKRFAKEIKAAGGIEAWCQARTDISSYETFRLCKRAEQYRYVAQEALDWLNNADREEFPGWKPKGNYAPRAFIELCEKYLNRDQPEPPQKNMGKDKGGKDKSNTTGDLAGEIDTPGLALAEARADRAEGMLSKAGSREKRLHQRIRGLERHVINCERLIRHLGGIPPKPTPLAEWLDEMGELEEDELDPPVINTRYPKATKASRKFGTPRKAGRKATRKAAAPRVPLRVSVAAAWNGESYALDKLPGIFASNRRALVISMMRFLNPPVGEEPQYPDATEIIGPFDEAAWWNADHAILVDPDDKAKRVPREPEPNPEP
jgi:hypothetical protein